MDDTPEHRETTRKHLAMCLERAGRGDVDIVHLHDAAMTRHIFEGNVELPVPVVMTLHVPAEDEADFKRWNASLVTSSAAYFVPISEFQGEEHRGLMNLEQVIHHGVDVEDYPFERAPGERDYLFSIGRITRDKGQDIAIRVARTTGARLVIAGNVQNKAKDRAFFEELEPSIDLLANADSPLAGGEYWYLHARATLFPIQWGEPFGLVLIESMACGTPVIALCKGSVPEIVVHGKTGFVVDSVEEMIGGVKDLDCIVRADCRSHVQESFSVTAMARKYAALYRRIMERG
jgi:glycosyltransferase involved in cell wall biosynthesis